MRTNYQHQTDPAGNRKGQLKASHAIFVAVILTALLLAGCASPTPVQQPAPAETQPVQAPAEQATLPAGSVEELIPEAQAFVDQLASGDFAAATSRFDATMLAALPEAKLKETWEQVVGQVGAYQEQLGTHTDEQQGYRRVFVTTRFENAVLDVLVVFDTQGQIAGLFFQPGQAPAATP